MAQKNVMPHLEADSDTSAILVPDPLSIERLRVRRTQSGPLVAPTAARSNFEVFKGVGEHAHKPLAKRWDHRLNLESASRKTSTLKGAAVYLSKPGIITLGGGLPIAEYFPFDEISVKVPNINEFSEPEVHSSGTTLTAGKYDMAAQKSIYDISVAFNYCQSSGSPQLTRFVHEHTELVHNPPYQDWQSILTIGSTSCLEMCMRMLGSRGTYILSEEYTFATAVETAAPLGMKFVGVKVDKEGLLPDSLDDILTTWTPEDHNGAPKPFILYTVPTGQNPTGATQSLERRRAIYAVAQKHDLMILEDEPYYFLQMQPYTGQNVPNAPKPASHAEFLKSLVPSLLSMDVDGRVLRMDSFSKVLAPGSRLGWVTGCQQLMEKYNRHADVSTQGPSGMSQLVLFKLLDEHWGHGGFLDWLLHIRLQYSQRRDTILGACENHLPTEIASWEPPAAGMFHWIKVDWKKHPLADKLSLIELEERIFLKTVDHGALIIRGSWFRADQGRHEIFGAAGRGEEAMFFRTTFAAAPADKLIEAIRRFGVALREEFGLTDATHTNGHA